MANKSTLVFVVVFVLSLSMALFSGCSTTEDNKTSDTGISSVHGAASNNTKGTQYHPCHIEINIDDRCDGDAVACLCIDDMSYAQFIENIFGVTKADMASEEKRVKKAGGAYKRYVLLDLSGYTEISDIDCVASIELISGPYNLANIFHKETDQYGNLNGKFSFVGAGGEIKRSLSFVYATNKEEAAQKTTASQGHVFYITEIIDNAGSTLDTTNTLDPTSYHPGHIELYPQEESDGRYCDAYLCVDGMSYWDLIYTLFTNKDFTKEDLKEAFRKEEELCNMSGISYSISLSVNNRSTPLSAFNNQAAIPINHGDLTSMKYMYFSRDFSSNSRLYLHYGKKEKESDLWVIFATNEEEAREKVNTANLYYRPINVFFVTDIIDKTTSNN